MINYECLLVTKFVVQLTRNTMINCLVEGPEKTRAFRNQKILSPCVGDQEVQKGIDLFLRQSL